jgi:hypothetical protein
VVDGYPVGFELVIGRAEDGPPAVVTPDVVELVPADGHIGVVSVSHLSWPIEMRSCLCAAHRSLSISPTLVVDMPAGPRTPVGPARARPAVCHLPWSSAGGTGAVPVAERPLQGDMAAALDPGMSTATTTFGDGWPLASLIVVTAGIKVGCGRRQVTDMARLQRFTLVGLHRDAG